MARDVADATHAHDETLVTRPPDQKAAVSRCIAAYRQSFRNRFQQVPLITHGKDGRLMKSLLASWGENAVLASIDEFFATSDPRVQKSDFSISAFHYHAQRLRVQRVQPATDDRTLSNWHEAARAAGRGF